MFFLKYDPIQSPFAEKRFFQLGWTSPRLILQMKEIFFQKSLGKAFGKSQKSPHLNLLASSFMVELLMKSFPVEIHILHSHHTSSNAENFHGSKRRCCGSAPDLLTQNLAHIDLREISTCFLAFLLQRPFRLP